jgi:2-phosphoglycerate kinase
MGLRVEPTIIANNPAWNVLLLGGVSGTGKTTGAKLISQQLGIAWIQVDDLRLALERSQVTLPHGTERLYFFLQPNIWSLPASSLRDGLIGVGEMMAPAIEVVTENHDDQLDLAVIEGDGILPSLFARPSMRTRLDDGRVRGVFLVEPDRDELLRNMLMRGRGFDRLTDAEQRNEAKAKWFFGQWIEQEANRYGLPVLRPRPWETLTGRILETARGMS